MLGVDVEEEYPESVIVLGVPGTTDERDVNVSGKEPISFRLGSGSGVVYLCNDSSLS